MESKGSFDSYRMPDAMWERIRVLLRVYRTGPFGGSPRKDLRSVTDAIFYRLRTGCQWKAIPVCLASGSTAHAYFQEWVRLGIFADLWEIALQLYDDLVGLDWRWQSVYGAMSKGLMRATHKSFLDRTAALEFSDAKMHNVVTRSRARLSTHSNPTVNAVRYLHDSAEGYFLRKHRSAEIKKIAIWGIEAK